MKIQNTNTWRPVTMTETKDCTVRAFAAAASIDYRDAHEIARKAGRKNCRGFWSDKILRAARDAGMLTYSIVNMYEPSRIKGQWDNNRKSPYPTLAQVMPLLQQGRYILESHNHALAVVEGDVFDGPRLRLRTRIQTIYEIKM